MPFRSRARSGPRSSSPGATSSRSFPARSRGRSTRPGKTSLRGSPRSFSASGGTGATTRPARSPSTRSAWRTKSTWIRPITRRQGPPLARVLAKLKAGQPITVVTMGDSLTDTHHWANRETNWPALLKEQLEAKYKSTGDGRQPGDRRHAAAAESGADPRVGREGAGTGPGDDLFRRQRLGRGDARQAVPGGVPRRGGPRPPGDARQGRRADRFHGPGGVAVGGGGGAGGGVPSGGGTTATPAWPTRTRRSRRPARTTRRGSSSTSWTRRTSARSGTRCWRRRCWRRSRRARSDPRFALFSRDPEGSAGGRSDSPPGRG